MSSFAQKKRQFLAISALWAFLVLGSSFLSGSFTHRFLPTEFLHSLAHLGAYVFLAYFLAFYFRFERKLAFLRMTDGKLFCVTLGVCLAWGGLNEWIQAYEPGRVADWMDFAINGAGTLIGLAAFFIKDKLWRCRSEHSQ